MFLPLAMAVLSGSTPMTEYPYDGTMPHFRCGTFPSLLFRLVSHHSALHNHFEPTGTRIQTVLASRTKLSALLPLVQKQLSQ